MEDPGRRLRVFLCYDSQDKIALKELFARLKKERWIELWEDDENISLGQNRLNEVTTAIHKADVVIVILSTSSVSRNGFIQRELRMVWDVSLEKPIGTIFLIPIRLDDCEIPQFFKTHQWGDYFGAQKKSVNEKLIKSLRKRFSQITSIEEKPAFFEKNKWFKKKSLLYKSTSTFIVFVFIAIFSFVNKYENNDKEEFPITPSAISINQSNGNSDTVEVVEITPENSEEEFTISFKDKATMLKVPLGEFSMGSGLASHNVFVEEFWIDKYEITNLMYRSCVQDNYCNLPSNAVYFSNKDYDYFPVVFVSWNDAMNYCVWAGRRLPTEAEWEKAASWDSTNKEKKLYPWGKKVDCSFANFKSQDGLCMGHPVSVQEYSLGQSPVGAFNMAGNVWEWTSSLLISYPYDAYDGRESLDTFGSRVIRGGAWSSIFIQLQASSRDARDSNYTSDGVGFRCASDD